MTDPDKRQPVRLPTNYLLVSSRSATTRWLSALLPLALLAGAALAWLLLRG